MATPAQKRLKQHIDTLKWADGMFTAGNTSGDVDIEAIAAETLVVLEERRADVLCAAKDDGGRRCMLSKAHVTAPGGPTPHEFNMRGAADAGSSS